MRAKSVNENIKHLSGKDMSNYSIIDILAKCSDLFSLTYGPDGYEGYVPEELGLGEGGKYIELSIDFKTGQIQNWNPLTKQKILEIINSKNNRNKQ